jgi:putative transposase
MGKQSRIFVEGLSNHVIQKGNNGMSVFQRDADYQVLLALVRTAATNRQVAVHGFVCLATHFHLVVTPGAPQSLGRMMKEVDGRYARYFNRTYARTGPLWNGRYRSFVIDTELYWLTCLRYVEQNPVKAGIVTAADSYRWSSYAAHAFGNGVGWLADHPVYQALGNTAEKRQLAYRRLCSAPLTDDETVLVEEALVRANPSST